ncbi:hypothetical protein DIPPA_11175 [Diplonema papillatum]|nr:hypothetical protein DIPPA_11175 [Diplonema papillatum]
MFVIRVCAELNGVKHNVEVGFPAKPNISELAAEVERLFELETWLRGEEESCRRLRVDGFLVFLEGTRRWDALKMMGQVRHRTQLYALQRGPSPGGEDSDDAVLAEPCDEPSEADRFPLPPGETDAAWFVKRREGEKKREAALASCAANPPRATPRWKTPTMEPPHSARRIRRLQATTPWSPLPEAPAWDTRTARYRPAADPPRRHEWPPAPPLEDLGQRRQRQEEQQQQQQQQRSRSTTQAFDSPRHEGECLPFPGDSADDPSWQASEWPPAPPQEDRVQQQQQHSYSPAQAFDSPSARSRRRRDKIDALGFVEDSPQEDLIQQRQQQQQHSYSPSQAFDSPSARSRRRRHKGDTLGFLEDSPSWRAPEWPPAPPERDPIQHPRNPTQASGSPAARSRRRRHRSAPLVFVEDFADDPSSPCAAASRYPVGSQGSPAGGSAFAYSDSEEERAYQAWRMKEQDQLPGRAASAYYFRDDSSDSDWLDTKRDPYSMPPSAGYTDRGGEAALPHWSSVGRSSAHAFASPSKHRY